MDIHSNKLLFCSLLLISTFLQSQEFTPIVKQFTKNDYSASNQNWSVGQTADGMMYFGNNLGLLRFDGSQWEIIKMPQNKMVRSLMVDKNNRIYVGSFEEFGYFEKNNVGKLSYTSLSAKLNNYKMQNDEIWNILSYNGDIVFQSFTSYFTLNKNDEVQGIRCPFTFLFFNNYHNQIFSHTEQYGLSYLNKKANLFEPVKGIDLKNPLISILAFDKTRAIVVTKSAGLFLFDGQKLIPFKTNADEEIKHAEINKAVISPDGLILLGTILNGVTAINKNGIKLWTLNTSNVLQNNTILGMYCDRDNNLWLALDKGIALVQLNSSVRYLSAFNPSIGAIYSLTASQSNLFLGTNQGLYKANLDKTTNQIRNIELEPKLKGQVWTINNFDGQNICGNNEETVEVSSKVIQKISPVKGGICIAKGVIYGKEVLVQGTYTQLCIYEKENGTWKFSHSVDGFINPIRYLEIDYTGTIWASHLHQGLYSIRLTPDLHKIEQITLYKSLDQKNEYNINVFSVNNRVVFTDHTGFYTFDDIQKKIIPYKELNLSLGYFSHAYRITHFKDNLYWFIRNGEAALVDVEPSKSRIMDVIQYAEFLNQTVDDYQNIIPISENECLFTLENGLALYKYGSTPKTLKKTKLLLKSVQTLDAESKISEFLPISPVSIPKTTYSRNNIIFTVYFPQFNNLSNFSFRYKLVGLDKIWSDPTSNSQKEFNYLPYGDYTFQAQVLTKNDVELSTLAYSFEVKPPFYWSITARIIYVILFILLIYGIYLYIRKLFHVKKEKIHSEQEEIRKKEIEKREQQIMVLENEKLESELTLKSKKLAESTMTIIKKNEILVSLKEEVISHKEILGSQYPNKYFDKLIRMLDDNLSSEDDWAIFQTNFDRIHENFFRNLHTKFPELTSNDLRFCAYLRLNLTSKDIAHLLNISLKGVEVARSRIRKKIGLPSTKSLTEFMIEFK